MIRDFQVIIYRRRNDVTEDYNICIERSNVQNKNISWVHP